MPMMALPGGEVTQKSSKIVKKIKNFKNPKKFLEPNRGAGGFDMLIFSL